MKRFINFALIIFITISIVSCSKTTVVTKKPAALPPGQMKKLTGSKSAAPYAPGQQKKVSGSKSAASSAPGQQKKGGKSTAPGQKKKQ